MSRQKLFDAHSCPHFKCIHHQLIGLHHRIPVRMRQSQSLQALLQIRLIKEQRYMFCSLLPQSAHNIRQRISRQIQQHYFFGLLQPFPAHPGSLLIRSQLQIIPRSLQHLGGQRLLIFGISKHLVMHLGQAQQQTPFIIGSLTHIPQRHLLMNAYGLQLHARFVIPDIYFRLKGNISHHIFKHIRQ